MEVDECYICNDTKNDTLMTNICDCRERFIHKTCFVNLLQKTKFDNSCSVCKKKYKNVVITKSYRLNIKRCLMFTSLISIFILFLVLFAEKLFLAYSSSFIYECGEIYNLTAVNVTDVDEICSRGLIKKQRFYVISLVTYLFFIMTNMFVIVNIYKFYKNNFFDIKFVCTYTRDDEMGRRLSDCD